MLCLCYLSLIHFRQAINIIMISCNSEILCQVNNLYILWYSMLLQELLALAMSETEEHHIYLVERHLVGKLQICVAQQTLVYVGNGIASITLAVGKNNLYLWVVYQQANQFTACIACRTKNTYFNHQLLFFRCQYPE